MTESPPTTRLRDAVLANLPPELDLDRGNLLLAARPLAAGARDDAEEIAGRIAAACFSSVPATLRHGRVDARDLVFSGRYRGAPVVGTFDVLEARDAAGARAAVLVLTTLPAQDLDLDDPAPVLVLSGPDADLAHDVPPGEPPAAWSERVRAALDAAVPLEGGIEAETWPVRLPPSLLGDLAPASAPVQHLRIGDFHLLGVPGRPTAAAGAALAREAEALLGGNVAVVGPANGNVGRLADGVAWREGSPRDLYGPSVVETVAAAFPFAGPREVGADWARGYTRGRAERAELADRVRGLRRSAPAGLPWGCPLHLLAAAARPGERFLAPATISELRGRASGAGVPYDALLLLALSGRIDAPRLPAPETELIAPPALRTGVTIRRVWLDSPLPSGHPGNDRFPVEHYLPAGPPRGALIVLPIWKGGVLLAERIVAAHLAGIGFEAAILPLPWQFQRAARGVRGGDWTVSSDLERTERALRQAEADVRAVADWLDSRPVVPAGRLGITGISLGAHVAAASFRRDPRYRAGVFVMAGGDPASMIWAASRETSGMKRELLARGVTIEEVRERLAPLDPATPFEPLFPRFRGVLMVNGTEDTVIPPTNAKLLAASLGSARTLWYPESHYSMVRRIGEILAEMDRHLDEVFGERAD